MAIPALSFRASVRLPSSRFQPLLSEPGVPISGTGLSSWIMRLAHGPPGRFGHAGGLRTRHGFLLCIPTPSPARRRACSRLDNIEPVRFDSLTYACDASGIIALIAGSRHRHSRRPSSFRHRSTPEVPFLDRHYPASSVVRTSPPPRPAQPAPHEGSGWCVPHHRQGFPCCSHPPLPCVPPPIPRRDQPVRLSLTSRPVAAFPNVPAGRLPHSRFRGLLSVLWPVPRYALHEPYPFVEPRPSRVSAAHNGC